MLRRHILIKYSDVFQTAPDAAAYFEQARRSVGDIPLNVFATVNGYFSMEDAGIQAQGSLARELLSPIVRDMVGRFRQRRAGTDSVIFTRPSGLLNLKVLLAVARSEAEFNPATVGMLALHANDYTDISLPEADAEVFAVQNMPIWELQNPRDIADLLARYYFITHELYSHERSIVDLLDTEFGKPPRSVLIDGLTYEDYFALLFGLYTAASLAGQDRKTAILNLEEHLQLLGLSEEQSAEFISRRVATEEAFRAKFNTLDDPSSFMAHIARSTWALDFSSFRERPLLRLADGRVIVLDLQFLIENASVGIFWNVFKRLSKTGQKLLQGYWGTAFERYIHRLMQAHPPISGAYNFNHNASGLETDAILSVGRDAFVFEIKAGMLRHDVKCSRDVQTVRRAIEQKFVENSKGHPKGVSQLVARCIKVADHGIGTASFDRIYPVLVVEEPALQTPGINTYLARRLKSLLHGHDRIALLTVMTADELERLLPYLSAGDVTWKELIEARNDRGDVTAKPVSVTFSELTQGRDLKRRSNAVLGPVRNYLAEMLRRRYEHLKPQ